MCLHSVWKLSLLKISQEREKEGFASPIFMYLKYKDWVWVGHFRLLYSQWRGTSAFKTCFTLAVFVVYFRKKSAACQRYPSPSSSSKGSLNCEGPHVIGGMLCQIITLDIWLYHYTTYDQMENMGKNRKCPRPWHYREIIHMLSNITWQKLK